MLIELSPQVPLTFTPVRILLSSRATLFVNSLADPRPLQRTSDVSLSIHESISNKSSPSFVDQQTAFADGLAYVTSDNKVVMKGDNTTWLAEGVNRSR